jgi:hypothetical protein
MVEEKKNLVAFSKWIAPRKIEAISQIKTRIILVAVLKWVEFRKAVCL